MLNAFFRFASRVFVLCTSLMLAANAYPAARLKQCSVNPAAHAIIVGAGLIPARSAYEGRGQGQALPLQACSRPAHLKLATNLRQSKTPINEALRRELLEMRNADQAIRHKLIAAGMQDRRLVKEQDRIDARNTARLRVIFKQHGFPGFSLVGRDGASAAHTIVSHSPSLELKREALVLIEKAIEKGELPPVAIANLTDKVLKADGKPQRYGTVFDMIDGVMVMGEVEDPARLDERRAKLGMEPIAEYAKGLGEMYKMPVRLKR